MSSVKLAQDFDFRGRYVVKVVSIYDGDTVRIAFRHRGQTLQWRARMYGYDSPEMKPLKSEAKREAIIEAANAARTYLENLLPADRIVRADMLGFDKYGRILINLTYKGRVLNHLMIQAGHGVPYFGGTKAQKERDD